MADPQPTADVFEAAGRAYTLARFSYRLALYGSDEERERHIARDALDTANEPGLRAAAASAYRAGREAAARDIETNQGDRCPDCGGKPASTKWVRGNGDKIGRCGGGHTWTVRPKDWRPPAQIARGPVEVTRPAQTPAEPPGRPEVPTALAGPPTAEPDRFTGPSRPTPEPPHVRVEPGVRFGRPHIGGVTVEAIVGTLTAGDDPSTVADGYGLGRADLLLACWYVARHGPPCRREAWAGWLDRWEATIATTGYDPAAVPLPTEEVE